MAFELLTIDDPLGFFAMSPTFRFVAAKPLRYASRCKIRIFGFTTIGVSRMKVLLMISYFLTVGSNAFAAFVPAVICGDRELVIDFVPNTRDDQGQVVLKHKDAISELTSKDLLSTSEGNRLPYGQFIIANGEFIVRGNIVGGSTFVSIRMDNATESRSRTRQEYSVGVSCE